MNKKTCISRQSSILALRPLGVFMVFCVYLAMFVPDVYAKRQSEKNDDVKIQLSISEAQKKKGFCGSGKMSGNILFILDKSHSMSKPNMEFMRQEMITLLQEQLDAAVRTEKNAENSGSLSADKFMIVTVDDDLEHFPSNKKLLSFTDARKLKDAIKFVERQRIRMKGKGAVMRTALWDAMKLCERYNISWIYLFSGSAPVDMSNTKLAEFTQKIKARINVFAIGYSSPALEELARQHGGHYYELGDTEKTLSKCP